MSGHAEHTVVCASDAESSEMFALTVAIAFRRLVRWLRNESAKRSQDENRIVSDVIIEGGFPALASALGMDELGSVEPVEAAMRLGVDGVLELAGGIKIMASLTQISITFPAEPQLTVSLEAR